MATEDLKVLPIQRSVAVFDEDGNPVPNCNVGYGIWDKVGDAHTYLESKYGVGEIPYGVTIGVWEDTAHTKVREYQLSGGKTSADWKLKGITLASAVTQNGTDAVTGAAVYKYVEDKLKSPYTLKGTVANMAGLDDIENPVHGDVYLVLSEGSLYKCSQVSDKWDFELYTSGSPSRKQVFENIGNNDTIANVNVYYFNGTAWAFGTKTVKCKTGGTEPILYFEDFYVHILKPIEKDCGSSGMAMECVCTDIVLSQLEIYLAENAVSRLHKRERTTTSWVSMGSVGVTDDALARAIATKQDVFNTGDGLKLENGLLSLTNTGGSGNASVDTTNKLIKVTGADNKVYYVTANVLEVTKPVINGNSATIYTDSTSVNIGITAEAGADIYYTTNGATPTTTSTKSNSVAVSDCINNANDTNGKKVTIKAIAVKYGAPSEVTTLEVTIYRKVQNPAISVGGNDYASSRAVTITCGTTGADIYYTTDGTTPTTASTKYTAAFNVTTNNTVVKAIAVKTGWTLKGESASDSIVIGKAKMYRGLVGDSAPATEAAIKSALNGVEKDTLPLTYSITTAGQYKVCIAYPSSLGDLTSIKDGNGTEYLGDFTLTTVGNYKVYCMKSAGDQNGITYTFRR